MLTPRTSNMQEDDDDDALSADFTASSHDLSFSGTNKNTVLTTKTRDGDDISVVTSEWGMLQDEVKSSAGGVLIVSGDDSDAAECLCRTTDAACLLSLADDCSLPTNIGSIEFTKAATASTNNSLLLPPASIGPSHAAGKYVILALTITCCALTVAVGSLALSRNSWRTFALELQNGIMVKGVDETPAIDLLSWKEWQAREVWDDDEEDMEWEKEDLNSSSTVLLADNCWFKAEAHVKLGSCASNAKECLSDVSSSIFKAFEGFGNSLWESAANLKELDPLFDGKPLQAGVTLAGLTEASAMIASAAVAATDAMRIAVFEVSKAMDDSIVHVVEQARGAIEDASYSTRVG